jgi:Fe2+ or Zn2+ uptake regulation protein
MQKNGRADKTRAFLQIFREHHLKVRPQRVAIYQEILHSDTHPTADAVYQSVKKE